MEAPLLLARRPYGCIVHTIFTITALLASGVNGDCTLGRTDDLVESSVGFRNPGLYIDIDNPAACSGQITAWNICYYNPRLTSFADNIQISLGIWRPDTLRLVRVGVREETIAIPASPDIETFQCITVELSPDEYMDVSAGDLIGVLTNTPNAVLPVVGLFNGANRIFYSSSTATTVTTQAFTTLNGHVLHVTAEIAQATTAPVTTEQPVTLTTTQQLPTEQPVTLTTTQQPVDTPTTAETTTAVTPPSTDTTTTATPSTDTLTPITEPRPLTSGTSDETTAADITTPSIVDVPDPSSGLGTGGVSAIAFSLVVIVAVVVVITIFLLIFKQRRKKSATEDVQNTDEVPVAMTRGKKLKEFSMEECVAYGSTVSDTQKKDEADEVPVAMNECLAYGSTVAGEDIQHIYYEIPDTVFGGKDFNMEECVAYEPTVVMPGADSPNQGDLYEMVV